MTHSVNDAPVIAPLAQNPPLTPRIVSVDVYRGFVMLLMMAEVLSFSKVAKAFSQSRFWQILAFNQEHVAWAGCSLHDLIQPSFSFLVGVAVPFSIAGRKAKGATFGKLLQHTVVRSLVLVLLGIFLRSMYAQQTYFTFEDTLTQIGLGYTFLFLLAFTNNRTQVIALVAILFCYWLAFALYPLPGAGFNYSLAGVPQQWEYNFTGFAAHWNKNTNLAWAFDQWFLNIFPREQPFTNNGGGYATLSFIPTLGTMLLGLLAANILRSNLQLTAVRRFYVIGGALLAAAFVLHYTGINPIVKRIWTPAWVLFSGGCCFLLLGFFYLIIDVNKHQRPFFFLKVIGVNSIAAYIMAHTLVDFISASLRIHFNGYNLLFGAAFSPLVSGLLVLLTLWYLLYWMYNRKIFIKI